MVDGLNLHIVFHLSGGAGMKAEQERLSSLFRREFGDVQDCVFYSEDFKESIFKVQRPIFVQDEENRLFFEKLANLFEVTADLRPHFTQFHEGA